MKSVYTPLCTLHGCSRRRRYVFVRAKKGLDRSNDASQLAASDDMTMFQARSYFRVLK